MLKKVFAYILREVTSKKQILAFSHKDHPDVPLQVPGGTLEEGEDPLDGLKREVWEESGITDLQEVKKLGEADIYNPEADEEYHAYFYRCATSLEKDGWDHEVTGKGEDRGLRFSYQWLDPQEALLIHDYYFHVFMRPRYLPDLFTDESLLGLSNQKISLVPHTGSWKKEFKKEEKRLENKETYLEIQHVGSTFVPWLPAKPVIDIAVSAEHPEEEIGNIERCGYRYKGEMGVEGRYYFVKGPPENRTHHIHMFKKGSQRYQDHILFRNHLVSNRDTAEEYGRLKLRLWRQFRGQRKKYTEAKSDFIERVLSNIKNR